MLKTILVIISLTIIAICLLGLIVCFGALVILFFSDYSKLFFKLYIYFFEKEDYSIYKEAKNILKNGGTIPVCSSFTNTKEKEGIYFLVLPESVSLWKDTKPVLVEFHHFMIDELIEMANIQEIITSTREADNKHRKELEERIISLKKEIEKRKAKLAELEEKQ